MKKIFLLSIVALMFLQSEAQTTIVKRIQYDVQINGESQNELISLNNIPASTRLDFLNSLFESVKKGETKAYSLYHTNSIPVYTEIKKKEIGKHFNFKKEYTITIPNPLGDPNDPFDLVDTVIVDDVLISSLEITHIRFIEKWEEDVNGKIIKTIESFAPIYTDSFKSWGDLYFPDKHPVYWIKSVEMEKQSWTIKMLSETPIINEVPDSNWFISNIEPPYRIEWMSKVFGNAKSGKITVYEDFTCSENLTQGKVDSNLLIQYEVYTFNDFGEEGFEMVSIEIQPNEIHKIMFYEVWTIDSKLGFRKEVIVYAPKCFKNEELERVLFWIKNQPNSP